MTLSSFQKNENEQETQIQIIWIYNLDIGMEFGIEKWAWLIMKSEKRELAEGKKLSN